MKNFKLSIIAVVAAVTALAAVSCQKEDNTLYYNNLTMGNIVNGRFVSDQGNTFNIVEQTCEGKIDTLSRAITLCDVLKETEGQEKEYDVRLRGYAPVLVKNAVKLDDAVSEEINVKDPIFIDQLWYSGGYINMLVKYPVDLSSKQSKHMVNLVWNVDEKGTYILELRHNAFGEVRSGSERDMYLAGGYVSFPLARLIGADTAKLTFKWKWYKSAGGNWWTNEVIENAYEYDWLREGFEQVPQAASLSFKVPSKAE